MPYLFLSEVCCTLSAQFVLEAVVLVSVSARVHDCHSIEAHRHRELLQIE